MKIIRLLALILLFGCAARNGSVRHLTPGLQQMPSYWASNRINFTDLQTLTGGVTPSLIFWCDAQCGRNSGGTISVNGFNYPVCGTDRGASYQAMLQDGRHLVHTDTSDTAFTAHKTEPNKGLKPTYAHISTELRPFQDILRTTQSVEGFKINDGATQQLQQTVRIVYHNTDCDIATSPTYCQIEYNFKTCVIGKPHENKIMADPGQGGLIVVCRDTPGQTKHEVFKDYEFVIDNAWESFAGVLSSFENREALWGKNWDKRESWRILQTGYGQEVYGDDCYITGTFSEIR